MQILIFILEACIVLGAIYMGVRTGGIGLGLWGAVGVTILVFGFGVAPGTPPIEAVLIILAVIVAASTMQAAGGIDYLVSIATKIIQKNPSRITYVAPLVTFAFTSSAGTGNIYIPLIPVIAEVAHQNNIRPERPLAVSTIAAQMALVTSPVSAAMAVMLTLVGPLGYDLISIIAILLPATLIGIMAASFVQSFIGKPLQEDPEYKRRLAAGLVKPALGTEGEKNLKLPTSARISALFFLAGVAVIVFFGLFAQLRPQIPATNGGTTPLGMTVIIQLIMYTVATAIIMVNKVRPQQVMQMSVLTAGISSAIALFGLAWLADTFIQANNDLIINGLGTMVRIAPFTFAIALFGVSALTTSPSGATRAIMPIGILLAIPTQFLIAMWPSIIGVYFLPTNGSQIASVSLDETGTTRIGKYVLNHSFLIATLVSWVVAVAFGFLFAILLHGTG